MPSDRRLWAPSYAERRPGVGKLRVDWTHPVGREGAATDAGASRRAGIDPERTPRRAGRAPGDAIGPPRRRPGLSTPELRCREEWNVFY